jgi:hypothetical protein
MKVNRLAGTLVQPALSVMRWQVQIVTIWAGEASRAQGSAGANNVGWPYEQVSVVIRSFPIGVVEQTSECATLQDEVGDPSLGQCLSRDQSNRIGAKARGERCPGVSIMAPDGLGLGHRSEGLLLRRTLPLPSAKPLAA